MPPPPWAIGKGAAPPVTPAPPVPAPGGKSWGKGPSWEAPKGDLAQSFEEGLLRACHSQLVLLLTKAVSVYGGHTVWDSVGTIRILI